MQNKPYDRRSFLKTLGLTGVGLLTSGLFLKSGRVAALELCNKLDSKASASMMVTALKYVPISKKKGEKCANCIQFKQDSKDKKIGQCTILQNCSVEAAGWCASWSKKS